MERQREGNLDVAFDLDNTDDAITAPSASVSLNEGTFVGWFAPDFTATAGGKFEVFWDTDGARHVLYKQASLGGLEIYNDGRSTSFTSATWSTGVWTHFAFGYNKTGDVQSLWINGAAQSGSGATGTWGATSLGTNLYIGKRFTILDGEWFDGDVAECANYDVLLATADVLQLAAAKRPRHVRPDRLLAYWPLVRDGVPSFGEHLATTQGSPAVSDHPRMFVPQQRFVYPPPAAAVGGARRLIGKQFALAGAGGLVG